MSATTLPTSDLRQSPKSGEEAKSEALPDDSAQGDLAAVVRAWPTLPEAVRRQVVALVQAAHARQADTPHAGDTPAGLPTG